MKTYWKGIEELVEKNNNVTDQDFSHEPPVNLVAEGTNSNRRDFLKTFGFAIAGTAIAASCERPITKAIPYLIKPDEIIPGKSNYYASSFFDGELYSSVLVKVRDGRPIKLEGNSLSSISNGGTNSQIQGSVLELYDENRYRTPQVNQTASSWDEVDKQIIDHLSKSSGKIVLLSGGVISPTTLKVIDGFLASSENAEHLTYTPVSAAAIREANDMAFGQAVIPDYRFDKADLIVGVGADFLGTWISPVEYTSQYAVNRKPSQENPSMSRHIQIETGMSLTGSNADERISIKPSQQKAVLVNLLTELMALAGIDPGNGSLYVSPVAMAPVAKELWAHKGKSLVVCGANDVETQFIVNGINSLLDSYGATIDINRSLQTLQGDDNSMASLVREMNEGSVSGVIFYNVNPAYDYHAQDDFRQGVSKLDFSVSLGYTRDETSLLCDFVCPDHHFLEAWNDAMPKKGLFSLGQPAIRHIFDTRQAQESLMKWSGNEESFYDTLKTHWETEIYPLSDGGKDFRTFWNDCLHDGVFEIQAPDLPAPGFNIDLLSPILNKAPATPGGDMELELYIPVAIGTGKHANNPWLQEAPDPVSKVTWDNYAAVSPKFAEENDLSTGDVIKINNIIDIPVLVQPGQHYGTISVALGYGKETGGKASVGTGKNLYPLVRMENGFRTFHTPISIEKTGEVYDLASTQSHHSMEGRALIRETTIGAYAEDPAAGNEIHEEIEHHLDTLYDKHEYHGHHWGMSVDLSSCTGCNACVVGCIAENNIPVVGKEQIMASHEMHWIRIDRYYSGDPENPEVARQPVMCQHCDNAPCENVCPVAATTNSSEGINQMIYNRCVGTRYCNNNCPYKVRRFNWLDFTKADAIPKNTADPLDLTLDLSRMVLNPDVTVRAKGVMEKCSFCIQRIQEKKLEAKLENRPLEDGEILTACQQVCPAKAITFGDLNDENSEIARLVKNPRSYHLLEELHTLPSVSYLTNIRNKNEEA